MLGVFRLGSVFMMFRLQVAEVDDPKSFLSGLVKGIGPFFIFSGPRI